MCFQLPQATWWPASIVLASLPLSLCSLNSVTLKRLSFYSHTSSVSFLFTPRNWKLRVFSDYKGNLFSFRKLKAHTENQITCENHMTTENQLTPRPTHTHPHPHQGWWVFFGCFSRGWGKGLSVDSQSPTIWEAYSLKIKSKNLKASFVTGTFPVRLLFYLLCSA